MSERERRKRFDERLRAGVITLPRQIQPPADLWSGIAARLGTAPPAPALPLPPSPAWRSGGAIVSIAPPVTAWGVRPALAAALLLVAAGVAALRLMPGRAGWRVAGATGPYTLDAGRLETPGASRVELAVGRIGSITVEPDTRLRLLAERPEHRLGLERGAIAARISAPPRLFYVETPSATAVDLGCQYTLAVDGRGGSLIHVSVGWVELKHDGRTSIVPFNMSAYTRPGAAPGTPFADRAADALKDALYRFDFEGGGRTALAEVLSHAREADAISLWHLLERTTGAEREAVYLRLAALAPPPAGVSRDRVVALDRGALSRWWNALPGSPGTPPWWQRVAVRLSAWLGVI